MLPSWSNLRVKSELLANNSVTVRHNAVLLSYWICGPTSVGSSRCFGNMRRMRHGCTWIPCRVPLPSAFLPIAASCGPQMGCPVPNIEMKSLIWKWQSDTFCRIGISRTHTWNICIHMMYVCLLKLIMKLHTNASYIPSYIRCCVPALQVNVFQIWRPVSVCHQLS